MKGREWDKLFRRYLLADLPSFQGKGSLLFNAPVIHLLRGFSFDTSGFDRNTFYVHVFLQPLYVPRDHVAYLFGKRLYGRQGQSWSIDAEHQGATVEDVLASIKEQGLPFLGYVQTPGDLARKAPLVGGRGSDPNMSEAVAYSFVLAHEYAEARGALDRLQALLRAGDPADPWAAELLGRSQLVRERLERDPEEAIALLEEWNEQTRTNLRLPRD
jgi:hypothetical protein